MNIEESDVTDLADAASGAPATVFKPSDCQIIARGNEIFATTVAQIRREIGDAVAGQIEKSEYLVISNPESGQPCIAFVFSDFGDPQSAENDITHAFDPDGLDVGTQDNYLSLSPNTPAGVVYTHPGSGSVLGLDAAGGVAVGRGKVAYFGTNQKGEYVPVKVGNLAVAPQDTGNLEDPAQNLELGLDGLLTVYTQAEGSRIMLSDGVGNPEDITELATHVKAVFDPDSGQIIRLVQFDKDGRNPHNLDPDSNEIIAPMQSGKGILSCEVTDIFKGAYKVDAAVLGVIIASMFILQKIRKALT